jgi:hypothetical protein
MAKRTKKLEAVDGMKDVDRDEMGLIIQENVTGGKKKVRSIDELLGRTDNPYVGKTAEEYEEGLKKLTLVDLQKHATEVGLLPITNSKVLIGRLVVEFNKKARGYFNTITYNTIEPKNKTRLTEILKRGSN